MAREVILPQLSMGMSEGTIVEWLVETGQKVERDDPLVSIETEKVVTELPAPWGGFVHTLVAPGQTVPIETVIAKIFEAEQDMPKAESQTMPPATVNVPNRSKSAAAAGPWRRPGRIRASGLARRLARENDIDLSKVVGSGPGGRIVKRDLQELILADDANVPMKQGESLPLQPAAASAVHGPSRTVKARIPVSGMRRTIAERMTKSKNVAAETYIFFEVDVTAMLAARHTFLLREKELGVRISTTSIYARALALACRDVPICNAALIGEEIILWDEVHVGVAVAIPGKTEFESGLVVPVVRNVEKKGLLDIEKEIRELVARARQGALSAHDMADATITLSSSERLNTGGWMVATPLLSLPQVVAFGPNAPIRKPVVSEGGEIEIRTMAPCCLTFDHRAMDGEPAALFGRKLNEYLSKPELMLL